MGHARHSKAADPILDVVSVAGWIAAAAWELWFFWVVLTGGRLPVPAVDWRVDGSFFWAVTIFIFGTPILFGAVRLVAFGVAVVLREPFGALAARRRRA